MHIAWTRSRALLIAALAIGCGTDAEPVGEAISATALCGRLATELCAAESRCCEAHLAGDCEATQRARCERTLGRDARDGRLGYVATRGGELVAAVRSSVAQCGAAAPPWAAAVGLFAGTGALGADCTPPDASLGALQVAAMSCAGGAACRVYLRTDGSAQGVCEARRDDACSHPDDCPVDQWCNLPAGWRPGVWGRCQPLRATGWNCASDLQCASLACSAAGVCVARERGATCLSRSYLELVREASPLAYLRLGDAASGVAVDASGNARDGAYMGAVTRGDGALSTDDDGALRLDGRGGHASLDAIDALADGGAFSVECWARPEAIMGTRPLIEFVGPMGAAGVGVWTADARLVADFVDRAGMSHRAQSEMGALAAQQWRHVAITYDGAAATLYVQGEPAGQVALTAALRTDGALVVGHRAARGMTAAVSFAGLVDELAVYPRALTPDEVRRHHDAAEARVAQTYPLFSWLR